MNSFDKLDYPNYNFTQSIINSGYTLKSVDPFFVNDVAANIVSLFSYPLTNTFLIFHNIKCILTSLNTPGNIIIRLFNSPAITFQAKTSIVTGSIYYEPFFEVNNLISQGIVSTNNLTWVVASGYYIKY